MTATMAGPPVILDGPVPEAPPFNILTVAEEGRRIGGDDGIASRWLNGAQIWSYPSDAGEGIDPCETGTFRLKDEGGGTVNPLFGAFTGYLPDTCTAIAMDWEIFTQHANVVMDAITGSLLERQLASAAFKVDNPYLGDANAALPSGSTATSAVRSLAILEEAIAATERGGVIHATPGTIIAWASWNLIIRVGDHLETPGGTPVIRGTGYVDAFPINGVPAAGLNQQWAWASGPIIYQAGPLVMTPDTIREALDRSINEVTYRAERALLVAWDTQLQVAILVDRSL